MTFQTVSCEVSDLQFAVRVVCYAVRNLDFVIGIVKQRRCQQKVSRRAVSGEGNVVQRCETAQCGYIVLVSLDNEVVAEENKHVDAALGNHCTDLLVSAKRS